MTNSQKWAIIRAREQDITDAFDYESIEILDNTSETLDLDEWIQQKNLETMRACVLTKED